MAEYDISKITTPNGDTCNLKDINKLPKDFSGLSAKTTPATGDILPIESNGTTYKIDYNALAAAIIAQVTPAGIGLGTHVVCGEKATPSVANGTTVDLTTISIPSAGVWQVIFLGYSPVMASNKVDKQATTISIFVPSNSSVSWGGGSYHVTSLYATNVTCMFECTDAVTVTLRITNWEGSAMTAGTNYQFYAVRVG